MIPWRPIAELPDELKDGRKFLVIEKDVGELDIARWHKNHACGEYEGASPFTHFAEITPP